MKTSWDRWLLTQNITAERWGGPNPNFLTKKKQAMHSLGTFDPPNPGVDIKHKQSAVSGAVDQGVADPGLNEVKFKPSPVKVAELDSEARSKRTNDEVFADRKRAGGDKPAPVAKRVCQGRSYAAEVGTTAPADGR